MANYGGTLELRTRVLENRGWFGGGIGNGDTLIVTDSAIVGNVALGEGGGGIVNFGDGSARVVRSKVRANRARGSVGGGILNLGSLELVASKITKNVAGIAGGGIYNSMSDEIVGLVTLDAASSVTENHPDQCFGTPAC
jgi:hypothetical protein